MEKITSLQNPKIKNLIKMTKPQFRRSSGLIVIEGKRAVREAKKSNLSIKQAFYCPDLSSSALPKIPGAELFELSKELFQKVAYMEKPDGLIVLAEPRQQSLEDINLPQNPLVLVLESLEKPGNLGAILRSAYAAKVDLVIVNDLVVDLYNPNVIRASEGLVFGVNLVVSSVQEAFLFLKEKGIKIYAATTRAEKKYSEVDFSKASALVLGSEASGLSSNWLNLSQEEIKIPMRPEIDSLNVSVSAAIIIFEAWRQRGFV